MDFMQITNARLHWQHQQSQVQNTADVRVRASSSYKRADSKPEEKFSAERKLSNRTIIILSLILSWLLNVT